MTSYDQLPVYKASFDLLITISTSVKSFPREYKYTFGERLQNAALDTVTEITLAAL
ncbi:MAG: hypothetical protein LBD75_05405 [Candidatus Peribacteria bacterium]|jgi:hypothetical protein|nr:hypothetical protein [Candidatus Peribacteria bacterium]